MNSWILGSGGEMTATRSERRDNEVRVAAGEVTLEGNLEIPEGAEGVVLFAHGSGSSRFSPRNQFVARVLRQGGLATLLIDLLTREEEEVDQWNQQYRFDIDLLTDRLIGTTDWLAESPATRSLSIGYFGSSTGAAAALRAAVQRPEAVQAVVSRGGRPDLATTALPKVKAPTLLIVGGDDLAVIELNQRALRQLKAEKKLEIVPGATHLFEEPGTLEEVARLACNWFQRHLTSRSEAK
jgi:dienelactone hydrolase